MSKKVYTEKDIYEGMVLECVDNEYDWWVSGKQYIVDKNLCIYDEDHTQRDIKSIVNRLNDPNEYIAKFKVVESEEKEAWDNAVELFKERYGTEEDAGLFDEDTYHDDLLEDVKFDGSYNVLEIEVN